MKEKWEILETIPPGWRGVRDATNIPDGYQLICNNKSRFCGKRKTALIKKL